MMSIASALAGILAGDGASTAAVLHNCRFEGGGATAYGREAILELFRRSPLPSQQPTVVATPRFAALANGNCAEPCALFADLHAGNIVRLWFLGRQQLAPTAEARIDVPFDFDLAQQAAALDFEPADHPQLAPAHAERVRRAALGFMPTLRAVAAPVLAADAALARVRAIVLRAFSDGESTAALFAIHALRIDGTPGLIQFAAAALMTAELSTPLIVVDEAQCTAELARGWHPIL